MRKAAMNSTTQKLRRGKYTHIGHPEHHFHIISQHYISHAASLSGHSTKRLPLAHNGGRINPSSTLIGSNSRNLRLYAPHGLQNFPAIAGACKK
jgi:hypothetical protein